MPVAGQRLKTVKRARCCERVTILKTHALAEGDLLALFFSLAIVAEQEDVVDELFNVPALNVNFVGSIGFWDWRELPTDLALADTEWASFQQQLNNHSFWALVCKSLVVCNVILPPFAAACMKQNEDLFYRLLEDERTNINEYHGLPLACAVLVKNNEMADTLLADERFALDQPWCNDAVPTPLPVLVAACVNNMHALQQV